MPWNGETSAKQKKMPPPIISLGFSAQSEHHSATHLGNASTLNQIDNSR
jgi:hypothetical protein